VRRRLFWRKAIPVAIVFLFVVVAFSPIYVHSNGLFSTHENGIKNNPEVNSPSANSSPSNAGCVKSTLVLSSNSQLNGNVVKVFNELYPTAVAYNPANKYIYVTNFFSGNVTVINSTTDKIVQNITVGESPEGVAYNPANKYMYVANSISCNVTVINSTTDKTIHSFNVGYQPEGMAYDLQISTCML
jgi:40-residue YVTN family beta-propeller repeat